MLNAAILITLEVETHGINYHNHMFRKVSKYATVQEA